MDQDTFFFSPIDWKHIPVSLDVHSLIPCCTFFHLPLKFLRCVQDILCHTDWFKREKKKVWSSKSEQQPDNRQLIQEQWSHLDGLPLDHTAINLRLLSDTEQEYLFFHRVQIYCTFHAHLHLLGKAMFWTPVSSLPIAPPSVIIMIVVVHSFSHLYWGPLFFLWMRKEERIANSGTVFVAFAPPVQLHFHVQHIKNT